MFKRNDCRAFHICSSHFMWSLYESKNFISVTLTTISSSEALVEKTHHIYCLLWTFSKDSFGRTLMENFHDIP